MQCPSMSRWSFMQRQATAPLGLCFMRACTEVHTSRHCLDTLIPGESPAGWRGCGRLAHWCSFTR